MLDNKPSNIILTKGASSSRSASFFEEIFTISTHEIYYLTTLGQESYHEEGNKSSCIVFLERKCYLPTHNKQQLTHSWFLDVNSELIIHSEINLSVTNIYDLLQPTMSSATVTFIKTDSNNNKHVLCINGSICQSLTLSNVNATGLYMGAVMCKSARQTYVTTNKHGIKPHRSASKKLTADPVSPILMPLKAHRFFQMPALTKEQSKFMNTIRKDPTKEIKCSASIQDPDLVNRLVLQRTRLAQIGNEQALPSISVTHDNDEIWIKNLRSNKNGVLWRNQGPFLEEYDQVQAQQYFNTYLTRRDEYRDRVFRSFGEVNPNPVYWKSANVSLASDILKNVKSQSFRAFATRLVYDWHTTGRNLRKREPSNVSVSKCSLCDHSSEDQQHIIWHCQHPQMVACRNHHINKITKDSKNTTQSKCKSVSWMNKIQSIISNVNNWELLVGRVHSHHHGELTSIPKECKPMLVTQLTKYFNMTICLYSVRKICIAQDLHETGTSKAQSIDFERQRILTGEQLLGIASTDFITEQGVRVSRTTDTKEEEVQKSSKRMALSTFNSSLLRSEQKVADDKEQIIQNKLDKQYILKIRPDDLLAWTTKYESPIAIGSIDDTSTSANQRLSGLDVHWCNQKDHIDKSLEEISSMFPSFSLFSDKKLINNNIVTVSEPIEALKDTISKVANVKSHSPTHISKSSSQSKLTSINKVNASKKPKLKGSQMITQFFRKTNIKGCSGCEVNEQEVNLDPIFSQLDTVVSNNEVGEGYEDSKAEVIKTNNDVYINTVDRHSKVVSSSHMELSSSGSKPKKRQCIVKELVGVYNNDADIFNSDSAYSINDHGDNVDTESTQSSSTQSGRKRTQEYVSEVPLSGQTDAMKERQLDTKYHKDSQESNNYNKSVVEESSKRQAELQITSHISKARAIEGCSPGVPGGRTGQG